VQPAAPAPPPSQQQAPAAQAPPAPPPPSPPQQEANAAPPGKSVTSGVDSVIGQPAAFDSKCNALPVTVTITSPPANGTVSVVDAMVVAAVLKNGSDKGGCLGRQIAGKKVIYRSNPGFHGSDHVTYAAKSSAGGWSNTVNINVQ
jgi:hypothetical protein